MHTKLLLENVYRQKSVIQDSHLLGKPVKKCEPKLETGYNGLWNFVATEIIFAVQQKSECLTIPNCAFRVYFLFPLFFTPHLTDNCHTNVYRWKCWRTSKHELITYLYPWHMHEELTLEIHTERLCIRQDENNSELRLIYLSQTESKMQPDQSCEGFRIWIIC